MLLLGIQGEFEGSKITLLGQNRFGAYFYAYKRKSKLTFSMTENAKLTNPYQNILRFNDFWSENWKLLNFGGQKSTWDPSYRVVQGFALFFPPSRIFTTCPWFKETFGSQFRTFRPDRILIIILKHKKLFQINFFTTILKNDGISSFWHSKNHSFCKPDFW